ncbi:MAG: hypothetical protein Q4B43_07630 [Bacteroidota bacterium]|nr:hypothetical protein [Bacteroidota bacterium]
MKKWLVSSCVLVLFSAKAQTVYVDPGTTASLVGYALALQQGQEDIKEEQSKLKEMQLWVGSQVGLLDNTQNKLLKGLKEANGLITNCFQTVKIAKDCQRIYYLTNQLYNEVSQYPEYAVFAISAKQKLFQQVMGLSTEITDLLTSGENNLMTSGDRYRLLDRIGHRIKMIKISIYGILHKIRRARRIGFWRAANPFQGYINKDKDIIENILDRYDRLIN